MILSRPTINLYYDKIVDGQPVPNGITSYDFSLDYKRIPFGTDKYSPINNYTLLYNTLSALKVKKVNLFSGKEDSANLFYPIELTFGKHWFDVELTDFIPEKSINRIRKDKMKLLIFAPRISNDYQQLWKLRKILDKLIVVGIERSQIYIVLGDISRSYRKLFENNNVYGIDWWQIYAQLAYKSRYRMEDYSWAFPEKSFIPLSLKDIEDENFQFENWKPKRIFTALTGNTALHNTAFISELIYRKLDQYGIYSYNLENIQITKDYKDFRITDKSRGEVYINAKKEIIENLVIKKVIDYEYSKIKTDPLRINKAIFEDSLINIVSGSYSPMFDRAYLDEINVVSPGLGIWRQIAKGHPFMVLGCLNTIGYIGDQGYFTPTSIVNQQYDRVAETPKKVQLICNNIEQLSYLTETEIQDKINELIPFMQRNRQKFFESPNHRKFEKLFNEMKYE